MRTRLAGITSVLVLLGLLTTAPPASGASGDAPMLLGLGVGGDWRAELDDFAAQQGKAPAFSQLYWHPGLFPSTQPWAGGQLADLDARGITGWIEWTPDDLAAMAAGGEDGEIAAFFDSIDDFLLGGSGRGVVIAPMPEVNLDEHAWCCDPVAYQRAFRRMRVLAAEAGLGPAQVRFAFSANGFSTRGRSFDQFWPGDEHVDLVAFARLNRGTTHPDGWRDYENTFGIPITDLRAQLGTGKPIMVAQTGSVTAGGDRGAWLDDMFAGLKAHPQVVGAIYFNRNKSADFRIHEQASGIPLDSHFRSGYASWSAPGAVDWVFDGSLDAWVTGRGGTPAVWPPSADDPPPAVNPWSRDQAVTTRIGAANPRANAIAISQARFPADAADLVVLSRDDKFPDALAGTPLLGEGPLLLTPTNGLTGDVRAELDRALPSGGRVYLLGGTGALAPAIADELTEAGYDVRRLSGADRYKTAAAIAQEVSARYPEAANTVLVARGFGTPTNPTAAWADSVTGGGFAAWSRHPVVLSDSGSLSAEAAEVLDGRDRAVLLGGRSALSDQVAGQAAALVAGVDRSSGSGRDATAVQIMLELWQRPEGEGRYVVIDGYGTDGWAYGLPAAGLSADFAAPLLPVAPDVLPPATADALSSCFSKRVQTVVVGTASVVADAVLAAVEGRDNSCA